MVASRRPGGALDEWWELVIGILYADVPEMSIEESPISCDFVMSCAAASGVTNSFVLRQSARASSNVLSLGCTGWNSLQGDRNSW